MSVRPVKLLTSVVGPGGNRAFHRGELFVPADESLRQRMLDAGQCEEPVGVSARTGEPLPTPKISVRFRPSRSEDNEAVRATRAKLAAIDGQRRAADADLAKAHEDLRLYSERDMLAADADAMLTGAELSDETPRLDSAIRLADRRRKATEELHKRATGELNAAIGKARDAVVSDASATVAEIRGRLIKSIEAARCALADVSELKSRMAGADAPLPATTLAVTVFDADGIHGALLDEALLQLMGDFRPVAESPAANIGPQPAIPHGGRFMRL